MLEAADQLERITWATLMRNAVFDSSFGLFICQKEIKNLEVVLDKDVCFSYVMFQINQHE